MTDEAAGRDGPARDAILDAAEELFARQGFPGTTIKQIGAAAGVNPALLYYYFGNKEALYRELLTRLFSRIASTGTDRLAAARTPDEAVRVVIALQSEVMRAHPSIPRLLSRELADSGAAHAQEGITQLAVTVFARLCAMIEEGQRAGIFRADMDARFAAVSTVSLIPWFHVARPAVAILLGTEGGPSPEQMEAYGRHAAEFALAALTAPRPGEKR
ncbi:TetR/AcrR family transcriptional regulator [Longimicrobium sp.]|jgi:AcrR family transcriptional regulator|uniref:TetR/AcrR family transcriptional regulator n=1 Tax=Longimicrobium sp. TaxID=2029185 RepID=UPI002F92889A